MKPEIMGLIPSGAANLWAQIFYVCPHSTSENHILFKENLYFCKTLELPLTFIYF